MIICEAPSTNSLSPISPMNSLSESPRNYLAIVFLHLWLIVQKKLYNSIFLTKQS